MIGNETGIKKESDGMIGNLEEPIKRGKRNFLLEIVKNSQKSKK